MTEQYTYLLDKKIWNIEDFKLYLEYNGDVKFKLSDGTTDYDGIITIDDYNHFVDNLPIFTQLKLLLNKEE